MLKKELSKPRGCAIQCAHDIGANGNRCPKRNMIYIEAFRRGMDVFEIINNCNFRDQSWILEPAVESRLPHRVTTTVSFALTL